MSSHHCYHSLFTQAVHVPSMSPTSTHISMLRMLLPPPCTRCFPHTINAAITTHRLLLPAN